MDNLWVKANNICLHPQYPVIQQIRLGGEGVKDFCTLYWRVYAHARVLFSESHYGVRRFRFIFLSLSKKKSLPLTFCTRIIL